MCVFQSLEVHTAKALDSDSWLKVSSDSVLELLRMDTLDVKEAYLARALVWWGQFQLKADGHDPKDGVKLRSQILPGLKLIRFVTLTKTEFEDLMRRTALKAVLTFEEKHFIIKALVTKNWNSLLSDVSSPEITLPGRNPAKRWNCMGLHLQPVLRSMKITRNLLVVLLK